MTSLTLYVDIDLDDDVWANEFGLQRPEVKSDSAELLAKILVYGLRDHKYLLERAVVSAGRGKSTVVLAKLSDVE